MTGVRDLAADRRFRLPNRPANNQFNPSSGGPISAVLHRSVAGQEDRGAGRKARQLIVVVTREGG
jgi:hypothetical protein